jgi:hypothetical protein
VWTCGLGILVKIPAAFGIAFGIPRISRGK